MIDDNRAPADPSNMKPSMLWGERARLTRDEAQAGRWSEVIHLARFPDELCWRTARRMSPSTRRICACAAGISGEHQQDGEPLIASDKQHADVELHTRSYARA